MSSSNTSATDAYIATINSSLATFVRVWSFLMIVFGTIGHLLSIYVFTRASLRSNPCSRYFLASSLSGFLVIYMNVLLRLLQTGYNINFFVSSMAACKILTYLLLWIRSLTPCFIVLACADRFLCSSSSVAMRAWSNLRVASRTIPLTALIIGLVYVHAAIYYQFNQQQKTCTSTQGIYQTFYAICNLMAFSLGPSIAMLLFGLFTVRHVRHTVRRIVPHNTQIQAELQPHRPKKATERQLLRMMLVQCSVFSFASTPVGLYSIYTSVNTSLATNAVDKAISNFVTQATGFLALTGPCMSFYLFTLSSQLFRQELLRIFNVQRRVDQITNVNVIPLQRRN